MNTMVAKTLGYETSDATYIAEGPDHLPPQEGVCASACVFAFMGGISRWAISLDYLDQIAVDAVGNLAVHQFSADESLSRLDGGQLDKILSVGQIANGILLDYVTRMGISPELLAIAAKSPPHELHWLTDQELRSTKLESAVPSFSVALGTMKDGAAVEIRFTNDKEDVVADLYCDKERRLMLAYDILARYDYDTAMDSIKEWNVFDNMVLADTRFSTTPSEVLKVRSINVIRKNEVNSEIKVLYQVGDKSVDELTSLKRFNVIGWGASRYGDEEATRLSFRLPADFSGMNVMARACLTQ